ncbi:MAG TPA: dihydroorotase, partial [Aggregatilineales bacterium]|nr:dihydroorotase [Aggregatilineales bacterium]
MKTLTITRPDDMHLHLRDGAEMKHILQDSARQFARAIVMPNLKPPVVTTTQALEYRDRILQSLPAGSDFQPLMTLYLTEKTSPAEIIQAKQSGQVYAVKYYPAGATTQSESGVIKVENVYPVLEAMEEQQLPLLLHGEVTDPDIDIFDRETVFIERVLVPLMQRFRKLRFVLEHITTKQAAEFVKHGPVNLAATITPQHLLLNRNALFAGGLRPHHYCVPVLKAEEHRQAVVAAAISGHPRFFLGTDSAPHAKHNKESACGCAGIYSAHNAIELYAEVFEAGGRLEKLEAFASHNGADFYG